MKKRNMIILLILILTIGFASVSTTLVLNGTINFAANENDFEVIFTSATIDGEETSKATISADKKTIKFTSNKLTELNEVTRLDYKVKNNSTQYGASVTINCTNDASEYINVESTFADKTIPLTDPIEMEAQEEKSGNISAKLIKAYTGEDSSISVTCTIVASATEKETVIDYTPVRYREEILNGADPVLAKGLVPITIENDGTVKKADITSEWYSYENKEWANAVILEDESVTYNVGENIPESNIESYFVWIPKYSYQLWNVASTVDSENIEKHSIEIVFGTENTKNINGESCATPIESGTSGECNNGEYMTHPSFISMNTNGLWVGKFETGYKGATTLEEAQTNAIDSSKIIVKPNTYSWRNSTVNNVFQTAYNYNRNLDSHMMKNTEWGAVTYLSHSKYGINKEVNINNNSNYLTGYSAVIGTDQSSYPGIYGTDSSVTLSYNTPTGYLASTTGNITGVYDMSGGTHEYMASYVSGQIGASGFSNTTNSIYIKYLDVYSASSNIQSYQYRILGDATGEAGPFLNYADKDGNSRYHNSWYSNDSNFVESNYPWFGRGGRYNNGILSGPFDFNCYGGEPHTYLGSRIVLAP